MSIYDVNEHLIALTQSASRNAAAREQAIARQFAARSMLDSGNFFIAQRAELLTIYSETLTEMSAYALGAVSPARAARAVRSAGATLEGDFSKRLRDISAGKASGNPLAATAVDSFLQEFAQSLRDGLIRVVRDTSNNRGNPLAEARGLEALIRRNIWKAMAALIGLAGLFVTVSAQLR